MKLSIVSTLFNSEKFLKTFLERIKKQVDRVAQKDYEIILVNDSSPDGSLQEAINLQKIYKSLKIIDLSRNFGQHKSIMTGLSYARGNYVFLIDCDLEEQPEWLSLFFDKISNSNADVIFGVQKVRRGNFWQKITGNLFWFIFQSLTGIYQIKNTVTTRLMKKKYVDSLIMHNEREIFLDGLWSLTGFNQIPIEVRKLNLNKSNYTFKKKISMFINSITSFSSLPLLIIFYLGLIISFFSGLYILFIMIQKFVVLKSVEGYASIISSIWFLGGIIITFIGIVGLYLSKIFIEVKQRPYTIIKNVYESSKEKIVSSDQ